MICSPAHRRRCVLQPYTPWLDAAGKLTQTAKQADDDRLLGGQADARLSILRDHQTRPLPRRPTEHHCTDRIGWLRAAVLGANDGIVSTASLLVGVASLVAGAMSMAAGEYVPVHSQADTENANLARQRAELAKSPEPEHKELAAIYVKRGLTPELALLVADQLMQRDALAAHARDEPGISGTFTARPVQAALASAASFAVGALLPLAVTALSPEWMLIPGIFATPTSRCSAPSPLRRAAPA